MPANLEGLATDPAQPDDGSPKRALVIAAHPDDADFGAAGTVHLWTTQGWEFHYLVCADGSKGTADPNMAPQTLIELRRQEQRDAARLLGVKQVHFLDYVDGELTPSRELLGDVVRVIREVKPYAVFTHDPESIIINNTMVNHSDHRVTGQVTMDAVYPAARDRLNFPEQIAVGLETHNVAEVYIWGSERSNFEVDITDVIELKVRAMLAHKSQFVEQDFIRQVQERWPDADGRYRETFRRVVMAF